jgi:hypothetical protein
MRRQIKCGEGQLVWGINGLPKILEIDARKTPRQWVRGLALVYRLGQGSCSP